MENLDSLREDLKKYSSKEKARILSRFFKTGPGEYGEGDVFIGVKVPEIRRVAKKYKDIGIKDIVRLMRSGIHEERLTALLMLVSKYKRSTEDDKEKIYNIYIKNIRYINNWDLVDSTAEHIVGAFLSDRDKGMLYDLAVSKALWERRIAVLSTFHYIKNGRFAETIKLAGMLLEDKEDLIHKAVGWMLREVGKRDMPSEESFLKKYYKRMPRTMLRYAIERFPEPKRQSYLKGRI